MGEQYSIEPLTRDKLQETIRLVHRIFPNEAKMPVNPGTALTVSLDPQNVEYIQFWEKDGSDWFEYFIARDIQADKVIGTSGLYHLKTDPTAIVYVGWFCVDEAYRRKGVGSALLAYTIERAKKLEKSTLRLYTDESENEEAQSLYEKFGFRTFKKEQGKQSILTYKELHFHAS